MFLNKILKIIFVTVDTPMMIFTNMEQKFIAIHGKEI